MKDTESGTKTETEYPTKEEILSHLYKPGQAERHELDKWKSLWYTAGNPIAYTRPARPGIDDEEDEWFNEDHEFKLRCPGWSKQPKHKKWIALKDLVYTLCIIHGVAPPIFVVDDGEWRYNPRTKTIKADYSNPSIISALHELGHHLYGTKELDACTFSVGLFKSCFPRAYRTLKWEGHALVK